MGRRGLTRGYPLRCEADSRPMDCLQEEIYICLITHPETAYRDFLVVERGYFVCGVVPQGMM